MSVKFPNFITFVNILHWNNNQIRTNLTVHLTVIYTFKLDKVRSNFLFYKMATTIVDQRPVAGGKAPRSKKKGSVSPTAGAPVNKRSVSGRNRVSFTSDQVSLFQINFKKEGNFELNLLSLY